MALFNSGDERHGVVVLFFKQIDGNLLTTWPVIAETAYLLRLNINAQIDFFEWLKREAIQIIEFEKKHLDRVIELLKKYSDVPMDFADASLMLAAESLGINDIVSLDNDFYVYKTKSRKVLNNPLLTFIERKH